MKGLTFFILLQCLLFSSFGEEIIGSKITPPVYGDRILILPMEMYADVFFAGIDQQFLSQNRILDVDVCKLSFSSEVFLKNKKVLEGALDRLGLSMYQMSNEPMVSESETCSTISINLGKITVLRFGNIYCAFLIENPRSEGQGEVVYEWWLQLDGTGNFSSPDIVTGKGLLSRGPLVQIGSVNDKVYDWDLGNNRISAGGFDLGCFNFNQLILPDVDFGVRLGVAVTQFENVEQVPIKLKTLDWKYNRVNDVSETHAVSKVNGAVLDMMKKGNRSPR